MPVIAATSEVNAYLPIDESYSFTSEEQLTLVESAAVKVEYLKEGVWTALAVSRSTRDSGLEKPKIRITSLGDSTKDGVALFQTLVGDGSAPPRDLTFNIRPVKVKISVDSTRDGRVDMGDIDTSRWIWGKTGTGAVIMVNNDRDISDFAPAVGEKSEFAPLVVHAVRSGTLPKNYQLELVIDPSLGEKISLYRKRSDGRIEYVLGKNRANPNGPTRHVSQPLDPSLLHECFVEAHGFADGSFDGYLPVKARLVDTDSRQIVDTDMAVFKVAPWTMTPHNLDVEKVYVCDFKEMQHRGIMHDNSAFVKGLEKVLQARGIPLQKIASDYHGGDTWIQDEMEVGYVRGATHAMPVVFDMPRDRGLDDFPETLISPDFGHFDIKNWRRSSLDYGGNLEVSPPVTVNGENYPFGRIIYGGPDRTNPNTPYDGEVLPEVSRFLEAQEIQKPIEIFTDWLAVGHVDEIISFVPANTPKGFQLLIASVDKTRKILQDLSHRGHGNAVLFKGRKRYAAGLPPSQWPSAEMTVDQLLNDRAFWKENGLFQQYIDQAQTKLMSELGLSNGDIVSIPTLFWPRNPQWADRTVAFFPGMINHLVVGDLSVVPKPYGPEVNGVDVFEQAFRDALPARDVEFIDDWYSYHEQMGEVHCGTNTLRKPFENLNWWEHKPPGAQNY